jgi:hypothetical protein
LAKTIVDKLSGWIKGQGDKQSKRKSPWKWVTGLLVGAVALFTIGFMYWRAWKQGRELAKLKHQRDVADEEKKQAKITEAMAANDAKASLHSLEAKKAELKVEKIDMELRNIEHDKRITNSEIGNLKNWRDIDGYLSDSDSPGAA